MSIRVQGVTRKYGSYLALDDVSVDIPAGKLVAFLGPSGSGKTTLLRIIAGLDHPDRGSIHFHDEDVSTTKARDRNVGFVFQHYALFKHMTVFENIAFGLRVRRRPAAEVRRRVEELLALVRLESLGGRYPNELSGGQRQRVALARSLAARPKVLLLDEPFGALDAKVRQELRTWLRKLHDELPVTTLFVTHDQEEAFEVADRVVVLRAGKIEQVGSPQEVFDHPATPFVMDFLGHVNVFHGRVHDGVADVGMFRIAYDGPAESAGRDAKVYVRPHELEIARTANGTAAVAGRVVQLSPAGALVKARVHSEDFGVDLAVDLLRDHARELNLALGDRVFVAPKRVRVFAPEDYAI